MTTPNLITDAAAAHQFIFGGRSRFTLVSKKTEKRYTYRVAKAKDSDDMFFASLLVGQNNEQDYEYIGFVKTGSTHSELIAGRKGNPNHPAFKGLSWLLSKIENSNPLTMPDDVEFWHEGRCARCGRALTDPASIEAGFGPECIGKM